MKKAENGTYKLNEDNWGHSHYHLKNLKAFVSLGAEKNNDISEAKEIYFVTSSSSSTGSPGTSFEVGFEKEHFNKTFPSLDKAISFINRRYGHWHFINREEVVSQDGCAGCGAH